MAVFWKYFRDVLQWPLIHRPGPITALVEGIARVFDDVRGDILWMREQYAPAVCEEAMLPFHGESRGVERHPLESTEQFRTRVSRAYAWQMMGGKAVGLPQILEHYGYPGGEVLNLREEDPARWAEFKVRLDAREGLEANDYALISYVANDAKAARSRLTGLVTVGGTECPVSCACGLMGGTLAELVPAPPEDTELPASVQAGGYIHSVTAVDC